jgi:hypothetical protein
MADSLLDEVIDLCDVEPTLARKAINQALARSGFTGDSPTAGDFRRAVPELRRALESVVPPAQAYEAAERVELLLSDRPSAKPAAVGASNLEEVTRQLRDNNRRLSERDFAGEVADMEAEMIVRRQRRSLIPPALGGGPTPPASEAPPQAARRRSND